MAPTYHGGLPTALLSDCSPPPYTFVSSYLNISLKHWLKSLVHGLNQSEDTLKTRITIVPPSITTTHHDGGLPSPSSYTLADNNPPLSSSYPTFKAKFKEKLPISKRQVDKMGRLCSLWTNWKHNKRWGQTAVCELVIWF